MNNDKRFSAVYLCPIGEVGGAEMSMLDLISRLGGEEFPITAVLLNEGPLEEKLRDLNVPYDVCRLPRRVAALSRSRRPSVADCLLVPLLLVSFVLRLRRVIRRRRPGVIISNGIKCHVLSPFVALGTRAKLIWHVRDVLAGGFLRRWLRMTAKLFCSLVVANSFAVAKTIATKKTVTVHNGIDLTAFTSDQAPLDRRKDLGLPADAYVIGTVGHLAPVKGQETLIAAASEILRRLPNAHFLVAGDAIYETHRHYERQLKERVRREGLADRVHFLGFRSDVPRLLATFDLFVLPSRSEGFGRVVAEALAIGCPVVCTAVGGVPEIVQDGTHGLLVPPEDPEALASTVLRLANDPPLRRRLADQGKQRVREHFELQKQTSLFRTMVLSVLSERVG